LIGYPVSAADGATVFERLGMASWREADDVLAVEVPGYRVDIEREVDLIEEVVRIQGYDRVGSTLPPIRRGGGFTEAYTFRTRARRSLQRAGLREVILLSFASEEDLRFTGDPVDTAIRVTNPLQADQGYLRARLLPGLLRAVQRNMNRHARGIALFEVGTVFRLSQDGRAEERASAAIVMTGFAAQSWAEPARPFDFFDAKGVVEAVLEDSGVRGWSLGDPHEPILHPGRSATIFADGERLGSVGEINPAVAQRLDLGGRVAAAELDLEALMRLGSSEVQISEVPRFPPVRRDLAFTVDSGIAGGAVQAALILAGGDLLESCVLFDAFSGPPLPAGKKSLAFSVDLRAPNRTLTDAEADEVVSEIVTRLAGEFGAELRSG
jgi:phenylalanyl-tRNA synthetase beta chain